MKKLVLFISFILVFGTSVSCAQKMEVGNSLINVGAGFVSGVGLTVTYDYGLIDSWGPGLFTIGGIVGFNTWRESYSQNNRYRETTWAFAPRATYRYSIIPQFEVYGSFMFGVRLNSYSDYYNNRLRVFVGATGGCRYIFNPRLSVFAEVGYMTSIINAGLSISI
ncbi:hypothetical protein LJB95_02920 [Paludibacteraceae bacterium OttesenSCG-928-F17]|nr:hypothetical protein [Paludibacteraceae bacterium OttesenSCG-928-F17]